MCRPAPVHFFFFSPTSGIHFCFLHTRSFLWIEILPWCKHGTMPIGPPNLHNFPFSTLYQPPVSRDSFPSHTGKWGFCTDWWNTFLGSPYPQLYFDMDIALVQTRYHGDRSTPIYATFRSRPYTTPHDRGSLPALTGKWGFCTD